MPFHVEPSDEEQPDSDEAHRSRDEHARPSLPRHLVESPEPGQHRADQETHVGAGPGPGHDHTEHGSIMPCPPGWHTCPGSGRRPYRPTQDVPYQCQACGWEPRQLTWRPPWLLVPDHRNPNRKEEP